MRIDLLINGTENRNIVVTLDYSLGGYDFSKGDSQPRGYYLGVKPITINPDSEEFEAYTGFRNCIHEVERKSTTNYKNAVTKILAEEQTLLENMIHFTLVAENQTDQIDDIKARAIQAITEFEGGL